ncbi:MAG: serine--tRNA ligase [Solirubrobacterales bacterium]
MIRSDPQSVKDALARRGRAEAVDELVALDAERRALLPQIEERRAKQNAANDAIAEAKRAGGSADDAIAQMREIAGEVKRLEGELAKIDEQLNELLSAIPNLPDSSAPDGETEDDAEVVREVGEQTAFGFDPRDHLDLGTALGVIDMEKAAAASGARFAYLKGALVTLELALVQFAMAKLAAHGFTPVVPPVLVREEALFRTGFLPTDRAQIYEIAGDDLYLTGTSEVTLAALHADEIVADDALPLRYAGFSSCFRREAGAGGKDTRGIFRVHQFDKVEMFAFVKPEDSRDEHERILAIEEEIVGELGIPYRVVNIAAGDLGASAAKKYDLEAWLPGQDRYRELTSCSNTTDYQARRLKCRHRPDGGSPEPLHTLNGTAVAIGRTLIAIMENFQRADGSVEVPEALRPFGAPAEIR